MNPAKKPYPKKRTTLQRREGEKVCLLAALNAARSLPSVGAMYSANQFGASHVYPSQRLPPTFASSRWLREISRDQTFSLDRYRPREDCPLDDPSSEFPGKAFRLNKSITGSWYQGVDLSENRSGFKTRLFSIALPGSRIKTNRRCRGLVFLPIN